MRKNGFTMIELLVVLAILGLLLTLGLNTYTRSLSRGRDAKRVEDMKQIQKGFELYYSMNDSAYPIVCNSSSDIFTSEEFFPSGMPAAPAGSYAYFADVCADDAYRFCTGLENGSDYGNASCPTETGGAVCSYVDQEVATHYCVENVQ